MESTQAPGTGEVIDPGGHVNYHLAPGAFDT